MIGPVDGLTTQWHDAPAEAWVCRGSVVEFELRLPEAGIVTWSGATEFRRTRSMSRAVGVMSATGASSIAASVRYASGRMETCSCALTVVEYPHGKVVVFPVRPGEEAPLPGEDASNAETMDVFFAGNSIAPLIDLGGDRYRTSVSRRLNVETEVYPPGFAPLVEWRVDGVGRVLGRVMTEAIGTVGTFDIEVGPPASAESLTVETYSVRLTSPVESAGVIPQGVPVTFTAVTEPPGYEDEIRWVSSTKTGTATPVSGWGPEFTVTFDDTFGPDPSGRPWQWLGVRANNATRGQDQKPDVVYGVRDECGGCGVLVAYIGLSTGEELVSVVFESSSEVEDYAAQRLVGLTASELVAMEDSGNPALLMSIPAGQAASLWESGTFPNFSGTPGQRAILSRQSQVLMHAREMTTPLFAGGGGWTPNGCTLSPDFTFTHCCDAHDACYCAGGTSADRKTCDQALRACIIAAGYPNLAEVYYGAVRAFGWAYWP